MFEAVVTWVSHDVENRKSRFDSLMENVKLSRCSPSFLRDIVREEPLMQSMKCLNLLADAALGCGTSQPEQADLDYNTLVAVYADNAYILKGGESEWVSKTSTDGKKLNYCSVCMIGDGIVITGGRSNGNSSQCWEHTVPTMEWIALPDLNVARFDHATVCVGNQVYVLGGWNGKELQSVEYLDEQNGSWQVTCDMPSGLSAHTAVSYKHFIYVFGGIPAQPPFMLDTVSKKWSRKADMPSDCVLGSSVVYRDRIYVLGGQENCCMSYDPDQDQWKTHSEPAVNHDRASAVVWTDRILLCGGDDTTVIEEYNPDTDTWSEWKHRLPKAAGISPLVVPVHM